MVKSAQKVKRKRLKLLDGFEDWVPISDYLVNVWTFLYSNKQTNKQTNKQKTNKQPKQNKTKTNKQTKIKTKTKTKPTKQTHFVFGVKWTKRRENWPKLKQPRTSPTNELFFTEMNWMNVRVRYVHKLIKKKKLKSKLITACNIILTV